MTLHSSVNYKCDDCGTYFVPLPGADKCPKCGRMSREIFDDFVEATIQSALFNIRKYKSFIPGAWGVFTIGDHYYLHAFNFLHYAAATLKVNKRKLFEQEIPEKTAKEMAQKYLNKLDFRDQMYMIEPLSTYLTRVLYSEKYQHKDQA